MGTCETVPEPSVTLQMALLVKVGHGRTLSSTQDWTIEITGVWSLGLHTVWGLQDTGRGALPWSLNCTTVIWSTWRYLTDSSRYVVFTCCLCLWEHLLCFCLLDRTVKGERHAVKTVPVRNQTCQALLQGRLCTSGTCLNHSTTQGPSVTLFLCVLCVVLLDWKEVTKIAEAKLKSNVSVLSLQYCAFLCSALHSLSTHSHTLFGLPCFLIVVDVGALPKNDLCAQPARLPEWNIVQMGESVEDKSCIHKEGENDLIYEDEGTGCL